MVVVVVVVGNRRHDEVSVTLAAGGQESLVLVRQEARALQVEQDEKDKCQM